MIIDKQQPHEPIDETPPSDAPPSYEAASVTSGSGTFAYLRPLPTDQKTHGPPLSPSPSGSREPGPSKPGWLSTYFGRESQPVKELRETVLKLIRDVVKHGTQPGSLAIVLSCVEACRARGLSFESLMQEKSIEGHTPLYWTIVKRPVGAPIDPENATIGVIDLLLSFPLTQGTREDARQACLLNSDDELFQHLRRSPGFADISGSDDMLNLGETLPDKVQVRNEVGTQTGNFAVSIEIADFQRRMRITKRTRVEFIARGRIWSLDFYVNCVEPRGGSSSGTAKLGAWVVSVKLVGESPPTWLDSRVTIGALPSKDSRVVNPSPISIRLKTGREQMASDFYLPSWKRGWGTILETIEGGVEYDGCSHIRDDGTLLVLFEATLAKPTNIDECIIC